MRRLGGRWGPIHHAEPKSDKTQSTENPTQNYPNANVKTKLLIPPAFTNWAVRVPLLRACELRTFGRDSCEWCAQLVSFRFRWPSDTAHAHRDWTPWPASTAHSKFIEGHEDLARHTCGSLLAFTTDPRRDRLGGCWRLVASRRIPRHVCCILLSLTTFKSYKSV